jgi:hypothetical protein
MKYLTEPYKSPTVNFKKKIFVFLRISFQHAGGLLAIEKKWFFELGAYDPNIKIW